MATSISDWNAESSTLLHFTHTLTTALATDIVTVASKMVEVKLISLAQLREVQLQPKDSHLKASELVTHVIEQVRLQPGRFAVFLRVLEEVGLFEEVVRDVRMKYEQNQVEAKVIKITCKFCKCSFYFSYSLQVVYMIVRGHVILKILHQASNDPRTWLSP